jgi:hypothetical protein
LGERGREAPEGVAAERGITMINNISEGTLRVASKIDPSVAVHDREINQQKDRQIREARPVEQSASGTQTHKENTQADEESGKFLLAGKKMVFEKYDRNGELILRIPPSSKPVDQVA